MNLTAYLPFDENCKVDWNDVLTLENLQWGISTSFSRTFLLTFLDGSKYYSLCPLVDYINTNFPHNARYDSWSEDLGRKFIMTNKEIKRGEEITIEYSSRNNYFIDYNFCMDPCFHCSYDIILEHKFGRILANEKNNELKEKKREILNSIKGYYYITLNLNMNSTIETGVPLNFLRAVKLIYKDTLSAEDLEEVHTNSLYYDKEVLHHLKEIFEYSLKQYKTTFQEDVEMLKAEHIERNLKCAIVIRRDEKRILMNMINACDEQILIADAPRFENVFEVDETTGNVEIVKFIHSTPIIKISPDTISFKSSIDSGIGVFATRDIKIGESLMSVDTKDPLNIISRKTYLDYVHHLHPSLKTPEFENYINLYSQSSIISILLIYEKHRCDSNNTYFKHYANHLYEKYSENNIFHVTNEVWNEFQHSHVAKKAKEYFGFVLNAYHNVMKNKIHEYLIFPQECNLDWSKVLTLKEFQWGFAMSHSRTFKLDEAENSDFGMIPMLDFVNGNADFNAAFSSAGHIKSLKSIKEIQKGDEITIEYYSVNNYFLDYHFCLENSNHVPYEFSFDEEISELLKEEKSTSILSWMTSSKTESKIQKFIDQFKSGNNIIVQLSKQSSFGDIPQLFVGIVDYLKSVDEQEKNKILEEIDESKFDFMSRKLFSFINLKELFEKKLKKYATSIQQDDLHLQNVQDGNLKCAIIIRRDEKIILTRFIILFKETIDYVEKIKS